MSILKVWEDNSDASYYETDDYDTALNEYIDEHYPNVERYTEEYGKLYETLNVSEARVDLAGNVVYD